MPLNKFGVVADHLNGVVGRNSRNCNCERSDQIPWQVANSNHDKTLSLEIVNNFLDLILAPLIIHASPPGKGRRSFQDMDVVRIAD